MAEITCPRCSGKGKVVGTVGELFRIAREERDEGIQKVKRATGVGRMTISRFERGVPTTIGFDAIAALAKHYGLSLDEIAKALED